MRNRILLVCLLLSGFSGLAFELLWVRLLALSFGSTQLSFATVLAVFFGGLALGSWYSGRRVAGVRRPGRAYALVELGTGVLGVALYPVLVSLGGIFAAIDPGPGLGGALVRFVVAAPLLLVPTFLMGATLPLVTRAVIREDAELGRGTALIYGLNTLGAFLGAYLVTYHLLAGLGIFGTILLTAVFNLVAAGIAFALTGQDEVEVASEADPKAADEDDPAARKTRFVAIALTGLGGFAAISIQVVWVRLFSIFTEGTVYGVGSVLISVLIGIAVGAILIAPALKATRRPERWFVALQLITIAAVAVVAHQLRGVGITFGLLSRTVSPGLGLLHAQLGLVFLFTFIPTFCSGASFPLLIGIIEHRAERGGRALGGLYAANTVGSILGSLATGFVLLPQFGSPATLLLGLFALAAVAVLAAVLLPSEGPRIERLVWAAGAVALLSFYAGFDPIALGRPLPPRITAAALEADKRVMHDSTLFFAEGKNATAAVFESEALVGLTLNGLGQGGLTKRPPYHMFESMLVAAVPMTHAPKLERALVVGLGAGGTVDILREAQGLERLEVLELEPTVVDAVTRMFEGRPSPLDDPKVEVIVNDARHYLRVQARRAPGQYDLIASMPAHPWVANSIFTQEFFEIAKDNLTEQGVFASWFGVRLEDAPAQRALLRAFVSTFPYYVVYRVSEVQAYYLVGSKSPVTLDPARVTRLYEAPPLSRFPELAADGAHFLPKRLVASGTPETPAPPPGPVNTDDSAYVEVHAPRTATASRSREKILAADYLLPELVPEAQRAGFFLELVERQLGTPGGEPTLSSPKIDVGAAKRTLEAAASALGADASTYLQGRLLAVTGAADRARAAFARVSAADPELDRRARTFAALSYPPGSPEQAAQLAALPATTALRVHRLPAGRAAALEGLDPAVRPQAAADPVGWLLHLAAHPRDEEDLEGLRSDFRRQLGPVLSRTRFVELLEICAEVAERFELTDEARRCAGWKTKRLRSIAARATAAGRRSMAAGDFAGAARHFEVARTLAAPSPRLLEDLVGVYVELGDRAAVERTTDQMRFLGRTQAFVDAVVGAALQRRAARAASSR